MGSAGAGCWEERKKCRKVQDIKSSDPAGVYGSRGELPGRRDEGNFIRDEYYPWKGSTAPGGLEYVLLTSSVSVFVMVCDAL